MHAMTIDALAGATAYLKLTGDVTGGWMLAKGALAAPDSHRPALARVYADQILVGAQGLAAAVMAGSADLQSLGAEALS